MTGPLVTFERKGPAAWIAFNDPDNLNALSPALIAASVAALAEAERDPDVRAIVLTGTGRAFSAGANLREISGLFADGPEAVSREFLEPLKQFLRAVRESRKPVIAAVNGICMAGGMETILCCDMVVAAESAVIGDQHAVFGLLPAIGGAQGLIRTVGLMRAKEMLMTGGRYSAAQLQEWGLVNRVVPDGQLAGEVQKLAETLAQRSPGGLARMKQMANEEADMTWEQATRFELALIVGHLHGRDVGEGLAAFTEKRAPQFGRDKQ